MDLNKRGNKIIMEPTKEDILKYITEFDINTLKKIYKNYKKKEKPEEKTEEKEINIDKTTEKYKLVLNIINKLLENLGKDTIDDLTQFNKIDREDIILEKNKKILDDYQDEILKHFEKNEIGYYRKNKNKNYILTFLRHACDVIGLKFGYIQTQCPETILDKKFRRTHFLYSINNI